MKKTSGSLFKRNNDIYYVVWRFKGKTQWISTGTRDKKEAVKRKEEIMAPFMAKREGDVLRNIQSRIEGFNAEIAEHENSKHPPTSVANAWQTFINAHNRPDTGEATLQQYEYQFNRFTRWLTAKHKDAALLRDVSEEIAQEYAADLLANKLASDTFTKHVRLLQMVFKTLYKPAKLTVNPWDKGNITRKKNVQQSRRELTVEEVRKVCESAKGDMRLLFGLGIYTGLRLGDCVTMKWSDIDIAQKVIRRIQNKTGRKNPVPVFVPIHQDLLAMLSDIPQKNREKSLFPEFADIYLKGKRDYITNRIQSHFKKNGIQTNKDGTGPGTNKRAVVEVGFHSLRHTFVSICRTSGVPMAVVEAIVGHSNPAMTRHYTHIGEAASISAINSLPSLSGKSAPTLPAPSTPDMTKIQNILREMTSENWMAKRDELLALTENL